MKKYKLINRQTKKEYLCDKVTIDGFDYYVNDYIFDEVDGDLSKISLEKLILLSVATTNPSIDVPRVVVVNEVEELADITVKNHPANRTINEDGWMSTGFVYGYNKAKETYKFTGEDMIEFLHWVDGNFLWNDIDSFEHFTKHTFHTKKELLQLWLENKTETIYFE